MARTPTVAIVGRPNVGKSTLFNRLIGQRRAIVHDLPGVTRDRITGLSSLGDRPVQLIDTGGLVPGEDPLGLNEQVLLAVQESDLLLLLVDGRDGLLPADEEVWGTLRRHGRPAILLVNKSDVRDARENVAEFSRLGIEPMLLISAEHGRGMDDLHEAAAMMLPEADAPAPAEAPRIAIVGRPNVGKSSLLNRLAGEERALVSEVAGTTRDPVDTLIHDGDASYLVVDTAGIRRTSKMSGFPEEIAIMMARRQIEQAELAILVIDGSAGVTSGDLTIAGTIWELGRSALVVVNKWDLVTGEVRDALDESLPRLDEILSSPPRVNISALTGRAALKVLPALAPLLRAHRLKVPTAELNRILEQAIRRHAPPSERGKPWKA